MTSRRYDAPGPIAFRHDNETPVMWYAWMKLTLASAQVWQEAQTVMILRAFRLAAGGAAAQREMQRMMLEKGLAYTEAMATLATGGSMHAVVRRYRSQVKANRRRLSRR